MPIPRSFGFRWEISSPSMKMVPLVCCSRPIRIRSSVVFPQPLGPKTLKNSPSCTVKDIVFNTSFPSKFLYRSRTISFSCPNTSLSPAAFLFHVCPQYRAYRHRVSVSDNFLSCSSDPLRSLPERSALYHITENH